MALLLTPTQWTRQPQFPAWSDRGNSLARGLQFLSHPINGLGNLDASQQLRGWTGAASPTLTPSRAGIGHSLNGTTQYLVTPTAIAPSFPEQFTMFALAIPNTTSGERSLFGVSNSAAARPLFRLDTGNVGAGRINLQLQDDASAVSINLSPSGTYAAGDLIAVLATQSSVAARSAYLCVNGASITVASDTTSFAGRAFTSNQTEIGVLVRNSPVQFWSGVILLTAWWNRALTDSEARSVLLNPWQLFAPLPRRLWVGAAAAPGGFQAAWAVNANSYHSQGVSHAA